MSTLDQLPSLYLREAANPLPYFDRDDRPAAPLNFLPNHGCTCMLRSYEDIQTESAYIDKHGNECSINMAESNNIIWCKHCLDLQEQTPSGFVVHNIISSYVW